MEVKMPATQLVYTSFHCTTLSRKVILTSINFYFEADELTIGESDQKVVFDCADKKLCGVCKEWGRFRTYQWKKCSHPELKKIVSE